MPGARAEQNWQMPRSSRGRWGVGAGRSCNWLMHYEQVFFFSSLSKPCQVVQMFGLNPWFYIRKCNCIKGSNIYNKSGKSYLSSKHLIHVIQTIYTDFPMLHLGFPPQPGMIFLRKHYRTLIFTVISNNLLHSQLTINTQNLAYDDNSKLTVDFRRAATSWPPFSVRIPNRCNMMHREPDDLSTVPTREDASLVDFVENIFHFLHI